MLAGRSTTLIQSEMSQQLLDGFAMRLCPDIHDPQKMKPTDFAYTTLCSFKSRLKTFLFATSFPRGHLEMLHSYLTFWGFVIMNRQTKGKATSFTAARSKSGLLALIMAKLLFIH